MDAVCYIHGLNSSHRTFTYLADELAYPKNILVDYDSRQRIEYSVDEVAHAIPKDTGVVLIGHSLGGVIASLIAARKLADVKKLVTISAPLGGSRAAIYARWVITGVPLLGDITPNSNVIREIASTPIAVPKLSIISTAGSLPSSFMPNDSVVSVESQKMLPGARHLEVKANHFEVMLHEQMVEGIRNFLYEGVNGKKS